MTDIPALSVSAFRATPTGLIVQGAPEYEEWEAYVQGLLIVTDRVLFVLGDAIRYGEARWGERYAQALEATPYSYQTLANAKWVAGRIEPSRRHEALSWSHHAEVASLEPEEQDALLDEAEREAWTRDELRDEVRMVKGMLVDPFGQALARTIECARRLLPLADDGHVESIKTVVAMLEDMRDERGRGGVARAA